MVQLDFNWPGHLKALVEDIGHLGGVLFGIDMNCGWTGAEIVELLHDYAIETYAEDIWPEEDLYVFCVAKEDMEETYRILDNHGLPIVM